MASRGLSDAAALRGVDTAFLSKHALPLDARAFTSEEERDALERIAAAAKLGDLDAFGRNGAERVNADMSAIRDLQVSIFHDHMRFDVFHESLESELDFNSKEFLADFQKKHASKEKDLVAITSALESLGSKLQGFTAANPSERMPADPTAAKHMPTHRLTMKDAIGKVVQAKRLDHEKLRQKIVDVAADAVVEARILHSSSPGSTSRFFTSDDSMSSVGDKSSIGAPAAESQLPPDV